MPKRTDLKSILIIGPLLALLCAGCSGMERRQQFGSLAAAASSDFTRVPATPWSEAMWGMEISEKDPAQAFDTVKSYFRVVKLPEAPRPLRLRIEAGMNRAVWGFFQPELLLLDRDRGIVRSLGAPLAGVQPISAFPADTSLRGQVEIAEPAAQSAFLLVRTTDELPNPGAPWKHTAIIVTPPLVVPIHTERKRARWAMGWPMGWLRFELADGRSKDAQAH